MQELLKLFQKIEIVESSRQTKPGSIGYIMSISDMGAYNAIEIQAMFTRFGKSGKNRLSLSRIRTPLIDTDSLQISKNNIRTLEDLSGRELLPRGPRFKLVDSKIKVIQESSKDLTNLNTWDFMAYVSTISLFLSNNRIFRAVPNNDRIANVDNIDLGEFRADSIGSLIYNTFTSKIFHPRMEKYITYFGDVNNRRIWLHLLRKEISIYRQIITRQHNIILNRYRSSYLYLRNIAIDNGIIIKKLSSKIV